MNPAVANTFITPLKILLYVVYAIPYGRTCLIRGFPVTLFCQSHISSRGLMSESKFLCIFITLEHAVVFLSCFNVLASNNMSFVTFS